jgi:hypothetical protein
MKRVIGSTARRISDNGAEFGFAHRVRRFGLSRLEIVETNVRVA